MRFLVSSRIKSGGKINSTRLESITPLPKVKPNIHFVKLILVKSELNVQWFMFWTELHKSDCVVVYVLDRVT